MRVQCLARFSGIFALAVAVALASVYALEHIMSEPVSPVVIARDSNGVLDIHYVGCPGEVLTDIRITSEETSTTIWVGHGRFEASGITTIPLTSSFLSRHFHRPFEGLSRDSSISIAVTNAQGVINSVVFSPAELKANQAKADAWRIGPLDSVVGRVRQNAQCSTS